MVRYGQELNLNFKYESLLVCLLQDPTLKIYMQELKLEYGNLIHVILNSEKHQRFSQE